MKQLMKSISIILAVLLCGSINIHGQNELSDEQLLDAAREMMINTGVCALITQDEDGRSRVRSMDAFEPESDFTVWFGTNPRSRKVAQIKKDSTVTLYYFDADASGYVTIQGIAEIIDDWETKEKYWKDEWDSFYPDRIYDYVLIKVSPEWLEVISDKHEILGNPITWEPPKVLFNSKK
jgi:general stress protein 26